MLTALRPLFCKTEVMDLPFFVLFNNSLPSELSNFHIKILKLSNCIEKETLFS